MSAEQRPTDDLIAEGVERMDERVAARGPIEVRRAENFTTGELSWQAAQALERIREFYRTGR